ncbi:MAG: 50S ribosomal protein L9 [Candidatus Komeilibacteria bacterium]|nr:50S ribosomal protein L9 [Candidatus Komeilibacteria bacterium]
MQVILLKDLPPVGRKGEIKNVADGYALNFLLPKKLAVSATAEAIDKLQFNKTHQEQKQLLFLDKTSSALQKLNNKRLVFKAKASDKGTLFKAIAAADIIKAVAKEYHFVLEEAWLVLAKPLKELGQHPVTVKFQNESVVLIIDILKQDEQKK